MILDLARAVIVAVAVLWLPGYPWSRVLVGAADRVERSALAVAVSLGSVPALAAGGAALLHSGVTLPIAAASVALVTGAGVLAWARLGASGEVREPLLGPVALPPPLPRAALLALGVAAAMMLVVSTFPRLGPGLALPIGLVVLGAAGAYLVSARGWKRSGTGDTECSRDMYPREESSRPAGRWHGTLLSRRGLLGVVALLVLARGYAGPVLHDWPYLRGQDLYAHVVMTDLMLSRGSAGEFLVYPPGFHALAAVLVRLTGLGPLRLYALLVPALMLLPPLACYSLALRVFGRASAVAAAAFAGLLLASPWYFVRNGTYADLVAAQFLLVLAVLALALCLHSPSPRHGAFLALIGAAVVLYHPVASIYLALLLVAVAASVLPYLWLRDRPRGLALGGALALLGVLSVAYAWGPYDLPHTVGTLLGRGAATGAASHASMAISTQRPVELAAAPASLGQPVVWLGLFGLLALAACLPRVRAPGTLVAGLLILWCAVMFAGSVTPLSGFPVRFHRDLGVPLSILGAWAFVLALRSASLRRAPASALAAALILLACALGGGQLMAQAAGPSTYLFMTPGIESAGRWLRAHNSGGNILVSPHRNQVPANAMLAMGGYSGLPAYAPQQLRDPRAVPPRDRREALDVLSILRHPYTESSRALLRRHDVEYVVLYKRFRSGSYWAERPPEVDWTRFKRGAEPYETAYENEDVLILAVDRPSSGRSD